MGSRHTPIYTYTMDAKTTLNTTAAAGVTPPVSKGRAKLSGQSLTPAIIRAMAPGDEFADPQHPGLRVRCVSLKTPDAAGKPLTQAVFFYRYRNPAGALRQVEVGVLGAMTLTTIRAEWQRLKDEVRNGKDPREEAKSARRHAEAEVIAVKHAEREQALTVGRVIERYLSENVEKSRKAKGAAETRRLLTQLISLATWTAQRRMKASPSGRVRAKLPEGVRDVANLPAREFTREMAHDLLLAFGQTAPRSGGMARQELRGAWRYGIDAGFLPAPSPFEKTPGAKADNFGGAGLVAHSARERALSKDETGLLLRWMAEPGAYSRTVREVLELVLRTGLRSGEVCGIHSRELMRREGVLWIDIPAERMKAGKPHSVPLIGKAEQIILARMPETEGYIFPAKGGAKPIAQKVLGVEVYAHSARAKERGADAYKATRVCPVADWAPHDLRRTARTLLQDLRCPFEVAEAILAHVLPGVAGVYARSDLAEQKVEWLARLGEHLDGLVSAQANLSLVKVAA